MVTGENANDDAAPGPLLGRSRKRISRAANAVEDASDGSALDVLARFGFAVLAFVHILIGVIALQVSFGGSGEAEPTGALEALSESTAGPWSMLACAAGCAGLALWQFSEATLRARHLPRRKRLAKTVSSGSLVVIYGSMGGTFASFAVGDTSDSSEATQDLTRILLQSGAGLVLLYAIAGTILGVGVHFVVKGLRRGFRKELRRFTNTRRGAVVDAFGVVGHVAKGVALMLVAGLFLAAGLQRDPDESKGLDGSLKALQEHPLGDYVLSAIAVGLISYGIFAMIRAVYGRM